MLTRYASCWQRHATSWHLGLFFVLLMIWLFVLKKKAEWVFSFPKSFQTPSYNYSHPWNSGGSALQSLKVMACSEISLDLSYESLNKMDATLVWYTCKGIVKIPSCSARTFFPDVTNFKGIQNSFCIVPVWALSFIWSPHTYFLYLYLFILWKGRSMYGTTIAHQSGVLACMELPLVTRVVC